MARPPCVLASTIGIRVAGEVTRPSGLRAPPDGWNRLELDVPSLDRQRQRSAQPRHALLRGHPQRIPQVRLPGGGGAGARGYPHGESSLAGMETREGTEVCSGGRQDRSNPAFRSYFHSCVEHGARRWGGAGLQGLQVVIKRLRNTTGVDSYSTTPKTNTDMPSGLVEASEVTLPPNASLAPHT